MVWKSRMGRRGFLVRGALLTAGGAAWLATGCTTKDTQTSTKVDQTELGPTRAAIDQASRFLLEWLRTRSSVGTVAWSGAVPSCLFALSLAGRSREVVFADGADLRQFLGDAPFAGASLAETVQVLDQMTYINLAAGGTPAWKVRQEYLAMVLESGQLDGKNAALLRSLVLNRWLAIRGFGDSQLDGQLISRIVAFRQDGGWCSDSFSNELADREPNVDTNALAVMTGLADRNLLDLGRLVNGWRHFVNPTVEPTAVASLESTVAAGWALGLSSEDQEWVLSLQRSDGSFKANVVDKTSAAGPTAEALAYLASVNRSLW